MFWLEPRAPYSDALYEKMAAWSADLERRLRSMVGSAVRHEQRAIPRLVWQTWRTNQLPPALFAEREMTEEQGMLREELWCHERQVHRSGTGV